MLRHNWPRATQEHATRAGLDRRLDPAVQVRLDQRIAGCAETPVNRQHEVLGIAHDSVVSTLQLMLVTTDAEMRAAFVQAVRWIEIETSSQCNRRCAYCPNAELDRLSSNDFFDPVLYAGVLRDLGSIAYDGELVLVDTNEIFMHGRNLDYIAAARQALPACRIKLFSNGDYLDRAQLDRLITLGVDTLVVTFHPAAGKPYDEAELRARAARFAGRLGITLRLTSAEPGRHLYFSARFGRLHLNAGLQNFALTGHSWAGAVGDAGEFRRTATCTYPVRQFVLNHDADIFMCCLEPAGVSVDLPRLCQRQAAGLAACAADQCRKGHAVPQLHRPCRYRRKPVRRSCGTCQPAGALGAASIVRRRSIARFGGFVANAQSAWSRRAGCVSGRWRIALRLSVGVDGPAASLCQGSAVEKSNRRPSMEQITRIAVDTSKSVFTLHGVNQPGT